MESDDGRNRGVRLPALFHVEQAAELEQEIFFVVRKGDTVVFPANTDGFP